MERLGVRGGRRNAERARRATGSSRLRRSEGRAMIPPPHPPHRKALSGTSRGRGPSCPASSRWGRRRRRRRFGDGRGHCLGHGVSGASWRWRRRLLPRRVRGCPRGPGLPWTGSGSAVRVLRGRGWTAFNLETCRLMVSMLDRDMSGTMGFSEFKELWAVLNGWRQHFISFDTDRSGTVDPQELQKALGTMGFRLSPQAVTSIAKRYSTNGKITFDDYIACCVKLRALTDSFRRRDTAQQGVVNFPYDDFIQCVMSV
ncbi:sorcin isoform X1 [Notamacropus eugenii]|uniref:sorcin isoform X1 n=1 Tax=Notamacropus eugenii TaxID=9315 RepID=UPI003B67D885